MHRLAYALAISLTLSFTSPSAMSRTPTPPDLAALQQQVFAAERAFARSMAERRHEDFVAHLAEHTVFFTGGRTLHGRAAVAAGWKPWYELAQAPFSWAPDQVEVMAEGTLALSTGLVRNPAGQPIGRFNSIWRLEAPGVWRVVFDKGSPLTEEEKAGKAGN